MGLDLVLDEIENWPREELVDAIGNLSQALEQEQDKSDRLLESARRLGRFARARGREHREMARRLGNLEGAISQLSDHVIIAAEELRGTLGGGS